jgi:hypothetical protein
MIRTGRFNDLTVYVLEPGRSYTMGPVPSSQ